MIVLDTNTISELMKDAPDESVLFWLESLGGCDLYTTVVTMVEIAVGIKLLSEGKKRDILQRIYERTFADIFSDRILTFGVAAASHYSRIVPIRKRSGKVISVMDAIIASICIEHEASLVTRNTRDFENLGIELINPWLYK